MTFGYIAKWKDYDGTYHQLEMSGYPDPETAKRETLAEAAKSGWTPRKWWQWWRWDEHAEQYVHLTAFRRVQAQAFFLWLVLLAVITYCIGGR